MGKYAGDWGGNYCDDHIPEGFFVSDRYAEKNERNGHA
jgi:hypothetical protein